MRWSDYFYYDESSPTCLRWAVDVYSGQHRNIKNKSVGDIAGSLSRKYYSKVQVGSTLYPVHRVIYELVNCVEIAKGFIVDHEDGNIWNNVSSNLREIPREVNSRNQKMRSTNTSGTHGVTYNPQTDSWLARWNDGGQRSKSFSCKKYGESAKEMACKVRLAAIADLNSRGYGYTERHGDASNSS